MKSFPWSLYTKKISQKIESPRNAGTIAERSGMRRVFGQGGDKEDGNFIRFSLLVDKEDGHIVDAKYVLFGQTALIAAAEFVCDLIVGKNYDQARRVTADLIEKEGSDKKGQSFPKETYPHINLVIDALEEATDHCMDIPLPTSYIAPPMPTNMGEVLEGGIPNWENLSVPEQLQIINQVLDQDIRPYIALDAGGVEVINLLEGQQLIISYQGNCTSCYSSTGATLSYIQQVLRAKVHPNIEVKPTGDFLE
jgi:NifU-like protein